MSLRTSPQTGVAIPLIFKHLQRESPGFYSYPGDCHTSDRRHWFAMTFFTLFDPYGQFRKHSPFVQETEKNCLDWVHK